MIARIHLKNYMAHADTTIEPAPGLTLLVGPNNCGKSAVASALETLCQNVKGGYMLRHEAKECSVTIETDDGSSVTWKRKSSGSASYDVNGTLISRPNNDAAGLLEKVHEELRLPRVIANEGKDQFDIHFGRQKSPIFLLDESGGRAAVFFASSSDASRLLEIQKKHTDKVRAKKAEERAVKKDIERITQQRELLSGLELLEPEIEKLKKEYARLGAEQQRIERLSASLADLERTAGTVSSSREKALALEGLREPPQLVDTSLLENLGRDIRATEAGITLARSISGALGPLEVPPEIPSTLSLEKTIAQLVEAETATVRLSRLEREYAHLDEPPCIDRTDILASTVRNLKSAEQARASIRTAAAALETLREPPPIRSFESLESMIAATNRQLSEIAQYRKTAAVIDGDLAEVEQAIRQWAAENRICGTCGGTVDPERLLAGGHGHG